MGDLAYPSAVPVVVWSGGPWGVNFGRRGLFAGSATFGSTAWGTANLAIATPIYLPWQYPMKAIWWFNGSTISGNVDLGLYNKDFSLVASAGSTAQAGANGPQIIAKDVLLDAGQYYLAPALSSTTGTLECMTTGTAQRNSYVGICQMASALPLPTTFVPASAANGRIPKVGISTTTSFPV